jgi:lysophospholipase-2
MADTTQISSIPEPTYIQPKDQHKYTLIFLHGRQDTGTDLASDFISRQSTDGQTIAKIFPTMKFVFPSAKIRYSARFDHEFSQYSFAEALEGKEMISQWFDIWDVAKPTIRSELMFPGVSENIEQILGVVEEEANYVPLNHIFLGGISQGCATTIAMLLATCLRIGGFIGLSGWYPAQPGGPIKCTHFEGEDLTNGVPNAWRVVSSVLDRSIALNRTMDCPHGRFCRKCICCKGIPVLTAHSQDDEVRLTKPNLGDLLTKCQIVPYKQCLEMGNDMVQSDLFNVVAMQSYAVGGHQVHPVHGIDDIAKFMRKVIEVKCE